MKNHLTPLESAVLSMGRMAATAMLTLFVVFTLVGITAVIEHFVLGEVHLISLYIFAGVTILLVPSFGYSFFQLLSKTRSLSQQLEHRANHDQLTGVYSRHFLLEAINLELSRFSRHDKRFTLLFIDLDDFKPINDKFGHQVGDETLEVLAKSIGSCLRDIDILGRYGGDEFLVCLPETNTSQGKVIAQRIQNTLQDSLKSVNTHEINITASIGIFSPEDAAIDSEYIIEHADKAVYLAKMKGKNRIEIFE